MIETLSLEKIDIFGEKIDLEKTCESLRVENLKLYRDLERIETKIRQLCVIAYEKTEGYYFPDEVQFSDSLDNLQFLQEILTR